MTTTERTARFWDRIAERYSKRSLPDPDSTRRKLEITRSRMRPSDVIVDIGCGTGTIALELAPHAARLTGIDVSGEMVKIARRKASESSAANVEFLQAGVIEGLGRFEPGSVDGVCAYNILHLLSDWRSALQIIHKTLRPGGFFISSTVCLANSWVPYRPLIAVMRWFGKAPHVEFIRTETLLDGMRDAGFVGLARPDVGAGRIISFVVATRPT